MGFSSFAFMARRAAYDVKLKLRESLVTAALLLCGMLILFCAIAFGLASVYMALAQEMPAYLAALCVAGGLLIVAGGFIALALTRRPKASPSPSTAPPPPPKDSDPLTLAADALLQDAATQARQKPVSAMSAALLMGLIVGLLRQNGPRR